MARRQRRAALASAAAVVLAAASVRAQAPPPPPPPAADPASPCPLMAPNGGFRSFVAWTAIFNAQPHHVSAPFKRDLEPPITMPYFCEASTRWSASAWKYVGTRGSDWLVEPKGTPPSLLIGDSECSQQLVAVGVFTAIESHAAVRLHFEGCDRPSSNIAFRLTTGREASTGTGEPTVLGVDVLGWMCKIDPDGCVAAREKVHPGSVAPVVPPPAGPKIERSQVGNGKCAGYGVMPHVLSPAPGSAEACRSECEARINRNWHDPTRASCTAYAWSDNLKSCIVYDGRDIEGTSGQFGNDGYICERMANTQPRPSSSSSPDADVFLDLPRVFEDPRAITARRISVTPFVEGCFPDFNWYIIDRWMHISPKDYEIVAEMSKTNSSDPRYVFTQPSHGGHAPRSNLVIQRACIRDCSGALRAECVGLAAGLPAPPGFEKSGEGRIVPLASQSGTPRGIVRGILASVMGYRIANSFTEEDIFPMCVMSAAASVVCGALFTAALGQFWLRFCATPKYHRVEEVRLVYEGDEEETVALRTDDGSNVQVMSSLPLSTLNFYGFGSKWKPRKAGSERATANPAADPTGTWW